MCITQVLVSNRARKARLQKKKYLTRYFERRAYNFHEFDILISKVMVMFALGTVISYHVTAARVYSAEKFMTLIMQSYDSELTSSIGMQSLFA